LGDPFPDLDRHGDAIGPAGGTREAWKDGEANRGSPTNPPRRLRRPPPLLRLPGTPADHRHHRGCQAHPPAAGQVTDSGPDGPPARWPSGRPGRSWLGGGAAMRGSAQGQPVISDSSSGQDQRTSCHISQAGHSNAARSASSTTSRCLTVGRGVATDTGGSLTRLCYMHPDRLARPVIDSQHRHIGHANKKLTHAPGVNLQQGLSRSVGVRNRLILRVSTPRQGDGPTPPHPAQIRSARNGEWVEAG
jgi:hypothetical protein